MNRRSPIAQRKAGSRRGFDAIQLGGRVDTPLVSSSEALTVRLARPADTDAMREVVKAAYQLYVDRIGREPAPMTADYVRIARSGDAWVAEQGGCIVGLLVLEPAEDHLVLESVAVAPSAQGHGVGTRLLRWAEEQALARGLREVRLYTNEAMTENLAYYPRRGYRETHRATQNGFRRVFFTKVLG
jgi:GNAT superfamily N-acetyltransferase